MTVTATAPSDSPPRAGWDALDAELDAWAAAGRTASFWWRDDDAVEPTPELARMIALSGETGAPLALAVIPAHAKDSLAPALDTAPAVAVLQHGWSHRDHAVPPAKKAELGADRPAAAVLAELAEGWRVLDRLFGPRALPVLVPPWNRIAPGVTAGLPDAGFTGLSVFGPKCVSTVNMMCVNTHIDPVAWKDGKRFLGEPESLGMAVAHLRARRLGQADEGEPTGLLTHHLVMDGETWAFTARFLTVTRRHPAARWPGADALFVAEGAR
ncbi:polysaccharide deacetylase family protein [Azospirillum isscasi]|uniref:Polysaccharide deacetylase family protein n=1 Tax=Azospirillum isscasi TaxID=3053926 RepID=A0ABU0WBZ4_9PROT|nr:polysaccharide deacetylase family protein [Azospirillum isscasi]MDQ2101612.1 polysaccharide deacetylase family protein [Azospirillum isscasi]